MTEDNGGQLTNEQEDLGPEAEVQPVEEVSAVPPVDAPSESELVTQAIESSDSETEATSDEDTPPEMTQDSPEKQAEVDETVAELTDKPEADEQEEPLAELPAAEVEAPEAVSEQPATAETDSAEEDVAPEPATPAQEEPDDGRLWYVLHCYSGYENKVRHNLEQRIDSMGMKDSIFDVVVPTEEEIEVKEGKRRTVERRVFPGYILVNMILNEESWYVVRNTPGVTSFVGQGNEPLPLRPEEVSQIIKRMEADAPRIKVTFKQGERVRIIDGPFNDFRGTVDEIDMERAKVRVMVNFFGRETPVELDFLQVEKA